MHTIPNSQQPNQPLNPSLPILTKYGKSALQELLKLGSIEQASKPNIYRTLSMSLSAVNHALAPLDLMAQLDDIRGIVFVKVGTNIEMEANIGASNGIDVNNSINVVEPDFADNNTPQTDFVKQDTRSIEQQADEDWSHPLVRKQRLTLEQSLLLAILRQRYIEGEQQHGIGAGNIIAELDDLQSQLQVYMPTSGSDSTDERRLRTLLDQLAIHGVVSKIDNNDEVIIRPLIAHVANPENLSRLLQQVRRMTTEKDNSENTKKSNKDD